MACQRKQGNNEISDQRKMAYGMDLIHKMRKEKV